MHIVVAIFFTFLISCSGPDKKTPARPDTQMSLPIAEYPAEFPTGQTDFNLWVIERMQSVFESMPEEEVVNCTRLQVNFLVKKDGSINNVEVLNEVSGASKEKIKAIFYKMPTWKPATVGNKPIDYLYEMSGSIHFQ